MVNDATNSPGRVADSWADLLEPLKGGILGVVGHGSVSSAWAWGEGLALTVATGLRRGDRTQLLLPDCEASEAEVVGIDERLDIALLRAHGVPNSPVAMEQVVPRLGDPLAVIGRHHSGDAHASFGHAGLVGGNWRTVHGASVEHRIRLDGRLFPGLPGGAVVDSKGRIVGLATAALSRRHGMVLPTVTVQRVAAALVQNGYVARAHLGVAVQSATALVDGAKREGLLVTHISDGGAAERAGILVGDIIVEALGSATPGISELREALDRLTPQSSVPVKVSRGGAQVTVDANPWSAR